MMVELTLSGRDTRSLRALMAAEPVPGQPLPAPEVLEALDALVPSDELGAGYVDGTGLITAGTTMTRPVAAAAPWSPTWTCTRSTAGRSTWG